MACGGCGTKNRVPSAAAGLPRCAKCKSALPWIADADDATFAEIAERTTIPVIVDFWAPWCGPCRTVGPLLEQLAAEFAGRCKLVRVNVDQAPATSTKFGIQGIPTLVAMRNGSETARQVGAAPVERLRSWIDGAANAA